MGIFSKPKPAATATPARKGPGLTSPWATMHFLLSPPGLVLGGVFAVGFAIVTGYADAGLREFNLALVGLIPNLQLAVAFLGVVGLLLALALLKLPLDHPWHRAGRWLAIMSGVSLVATIYVIPNVIESVNRTHRAAFQIQQSIQAPEAPIPWPSASPLPARPVPTPHR